MPALPKANGALLAGEDDPVCHGEVYALWQGVSHRAERTARSGPESEMGEVFCGVGERVSPASGSRREKQKTPPKRSLDGAPSRLVLGGVPHTSWLVPSE